MPSPLPTSPGDAGRLPFGPDRGADVSAQVDELTEMRLRAQQRSTQLRAWLDVLMRGKWIIAVTLVAVMVPWTVYTFKQPHRFQATSTVLVRKQEGNLSSVLPTGGAAGAMLAQSDRRVGNELLVIRESLPLARRVAERLMAFRTVPGTREPITVTQGLASAEDVARRLQRYITAAPTGRDNDGITIQATSLMPGEAALIANLFAEEYAARTTDDSRASYRSSKQFLEEQLQRTGTELEGQEGALRAFMTQSGALNLDQESQLMVEQVSTLQAARDAANIELQMKRSEAEAIQRELAAIQPQVAQRLTAGVSTQIEALSRRIVEEEALIEAVWAAQPALRNAPTQPDYVAEKQRTIARTQAQIEALSAQLLEAANAAGGAASEADAGVGRAAVLRTRYVDALIQRAGLEAKTGVLSRRIGEYEGNLRAIPTQAIQLAQLTRARESSERLYLAIEQKLQEASVAEQSELGYAEVIRPAFRPTIPSGPNRKRNLMLGLLMGLGLGIGLATLRVALDHRLHRPEDLRSRGHTVLGTVPDLTPLVKADFGGQPTVSLDGHTFDTHLVSILNPLAPQAEVYRGIRTALQFSTPDRRLRTVLVTSANPSEGKSVTTLNLAATMAQFGLRVAVVDADLRKPSIHSKLGIRRQPGLVDLLFQQEPLDLERFRTPIDDLYVIPAGPQAPNPSELVGSRAMQALIARLADLVDIVLVDSPPVLVASDAPLLAAVCDATMVVVTSGKTRDYELDQAMEALGQVDANVVGAVLNRFDVSSAFAYRYRYGSYAYKGYAYGNKRYGAGSAAYGAGDGLAGGTTLVPSEATPDALTPPNPPRA